MVFLGREPSNSPANFLIVFCPRNAYTYIRGGSEQEFNVRKEYALV
jgi:hypothetical protein